MDELKFKDYNLDAYINIIKHSPIGICITDQEGYFEYVNPKYCELYGYSQEELIGKHFSVVTTADNKKRLTKLHDKFIKGKEEIEGEWHVINKQGEEMVILANAAKITCSNQNPKKVTYVIDITEKKEFEEKLKTKNEQMSSNIAKAKKLHKNLLPKKLPQIKNLDTAVYYKPAQELGGDFYNFIETENHLLFYIVDITGHGIDGALLNVFVRETINSFIHSNSKESISSQKITEFLAQKYREEGFPDDYFLCIMLGILNKETMEVTYSNAGIHIPPLLAINNQEVASLTATSLPISTVFDIDTIKISEENFYLNKGSALLITTDGLIEEVQEEELYGRDRLAWLFKNNVDLEASAILDLIKKDFKNFTGKLNNQDDITILIIKRNN
ncbi:MAG: SpoIIE family protein phosphatase [Bacillota bacterium]